MLILLLLPLLLMLSLLKCYLPYAVDAAVAVAVACAAGAVYWPRPDRLGSLSSPAKKASGRLLLRQIEEGGDWV